jgi:hypothetical protein
VLGSGYVYFVISLAMLGISAAGSWMSLVRREFDAQARQSLIFWSCILLALLLVGSNVGSAFFKQRINLAEAREAASSGFEGLVQYIVASRIWIALSMGALLSIPYFLFGFVLTLLFRSVPREVYPRLYFSDLLGGATGCVVAVLLMEHTSFGVSVLAPVVASLLAACAYIAGSRRAYAVASAAAAILVASISLAAPVQRLLEPEPQPNEIARDYKFERQVTGLWRGWNSFTRVGAMKSVSPNGETDYVMALGNGDGHAKLVPYRPEGYGDWQFLPAQVATLLGAPREALVLFAGVGADMLAIDYYTKGKSRITGVELNRTMIDGARSLPGFNLEAFYQRDGIDLVAEEARAFLERDRRRYDVILLSWSGATLAYYSGSIGHTTQFVYTREAMESILDHLAPNGVAVYINTNKICTLASLRAIMAARGLPHPEQAAVVLYRPGEESARWDRWWDENPALIKPSGFTRDEVARIKAGAERLGLQIAYAPYEPPTPGYQPYQEVLRAPDLAKALEQLSDQADLRFGIVTDDRPFSLDLFRPRDYLRPSFWTHSRSQAAVGRAETYHLQQILFVSAITLAAIVLILGPPLLAPGPRIGTGTIDHLFYFMALGAGFMWIEIGLMQKVSLLFGNPGLAIAIVLASLIFFTGLGSLASDSASRVGLTIRRSTVLLALYAAAYLLLGDRIIHTAMNWSLVEKALVVFAVVGPAGLIMGQFFPQGLARAQQDDPALVPWAWAINGASGTIAAGVAPLLAQATGFRSLVIAGACCYGVILLLPRYRGRRVRATLAEPVGVSN